MGCPQEIWQPGEPAVHRWRQRHLTLVRDQPEVPEHLAPVIRICNRAWRRNHPEVGVRLIDAKLAVGNPTKDDAKANSTYPYGTGSFQGNNFTPQANTVLAAFLLGADNGSANAGNSLTMTDTLGSHLTWTKRATANNSSAGKCHGALWTAPVGGSPQQMACVGDCGAISMVSYGLFVFEMTGVNSSAPVNGIATAITPADGAMTLTLSNAPTTNDIVISVFWLDGNTTGTCNWSEGAGFTNALGVAGTVLGGTASDAYGGAQYRGSSTSTTAGIADVRTGTMSTYAGAGIAAVFKAAAGSDLTYDVTDTLGITDSYEAVNTFDRSFTETLGLLDFASKNPELVVEDIMGLLDTAGASRGIFLEMVDGLGLVDSALTSEDISVFVQDVLGLTDVAASAAAFQQAFVEALGLTDSQEWVATFERAFADALGLLDFPTTTADFVREIADELGLADEADIDKVIALTVVDGLGLTDEAITNMQFRKAFVETVGLLDSIEPVAQYLRMVADSLGATDTVATQVNYVLTITDPLGLVDGISVVGGVPFIIRALPAATLRSQAIYGVRTKLSMPGRVYAADSQRNQGIYYTTTDETER